MTRLLPAISYVIEERRELSSGDANAPLTPLGNKLQVRAEVNIEKVLSKPNPKKNGSRIGPKRRTETVNPQTIGPSETGDLVPPAILVLRNVFGSGLEIRGPPRQRPARRLAEPSLSCSYSTVDARSSHVLTSSVQGIS